MDMLIADAQCEVRAVFAGGFWGQLVSSAIWLAGAALGTWNSPGAAILMVVIGGFFIYPATTVLLRLGGGPSSLPASNPMRELGIEIAFTLPFSMLLLVPVACWRLNWFFPALMILVGAHYLPFCFMYGMRMFAALGGAFIAGGVVIAERFAAWFSLGAWVGGAALFAFAWCARAAMRAEARSRSAAA